MAFTQGDNVLLPHQRLSAGIDEEVTAEFLCLCDDAVQLFQGQVQFVPILRCPAACTVQIAAGGRIHQDRPGHITVVFGAVGKACGGADHTGIDDKVFHQLAPLPVINFRIDAFDQLVPVIIRINQYVSYHGGLVFDATALVVLNEPVTHFDGIVFKVPVHIFQCLFGSENLETVRNTHDDSLLGMVHSG